MNSRECLICPNTFCHWQGDSEGCWGTCPLDDDPDDIDDELSDFYDP